MRKSIIFTLLGAATLALALLPDSVLSAPVAAFPNISIFGRYNNAEKALTATTDGYLNVKLAGGTAALDSYCLDVAHSTDICQSRLAEGQLKFLDAGSNGFVLDMNTDGTAQFFSKAGANTAMVSAAILSGGAGSAGAPSITGAGFTTTGLYFAAGPGLDITTNGTVRFGINSTGLLVGADNTYDAGSTGTGRFRSGYFGTNLFLQRAALATTSTDGFIAENLTAATGGVPVQMSPRTRWTGTAWDTAASETVAFFAETLPASAATPTGTWKIGYSLNGAAASYPMSLTSAGLLGTAAGINSGTFVTVADTSYLGALTRGVVQFPADGKFKFSNHADTTNVCWDFTTDATATLQDGDCSSVGNLFATGYVEVGAGSQVFWAGRSTLQSTANKLVQVGDTTGATGLELNGGTPTLGTCTGGTMVSGSHNTAGEVTGNTSGSCVINFGTPNFTNAPFCFIDDESTLTAVRVSAKSASSITVTGAGSGDSFAFFCIGRIGT